MTSSLDAGPRRRSTLVRTVLGRGWRKRCPHCGLGLLYAGWIQQLDRCSHCALVYQRDQGATWFLINVLDRFFLFPVIALIYFGVFQTHPRIGILSFVVVGAACAWTTPNRWGVGIAIHYLSRVFVDDSDDRVPDADLVVTAPPVPPGPSAK